VSEANQEGVTECPHAPFAKAMRKIGEALSFSSGLTASDRPDMPRNERPEFVLDNSLEIDLVNLMVDVLRNSRTGLECSRCGICPSMVLEETDRTDIEVPRSNRMPLGSSETEPLVAWLRSRTQ
jgi:hypothetical protein